jgi:hypothetical protein
LLTWIILSISLLILAISILRDSKRIGGLIEGATICGVLACGAAIVFIRQAIVDGSALGAARMVATAAMTIIVVTSGRPMRMLRIEAGGDDPPPGEVRVRRKYQWAFVITACVVVSAAYIFFPNFYD